MPCEDWLKWWHSLQASYADGNRMTFDALLAYRTAGKAVPISEIRQKSKYIPFILVLNKARHATYSYVVTVVTRLPDEKIDRFIADARTIDELYKLGYRDVSSNKDGISFSYSAFGEYDRNRIIRFTEASDVEFDVCDLVHIFCVFRCLNCCMGFWNLFVVDAGDYDETMTS